MSWAGSERWDLYLGAKTVGLCRDGRTAEWLEPTNVLAALPERFAAMKGAGRGRLGRPTVRIWLSAVHATPFVVSLPAGLKNAKEAFAIAQMQATDATRVPEPRTLWMREPGSGRACLAVAMARSLRDAIESTAKSLAVQVLTIRPWWARTLDEAVSRHSEIELFAAEDSDALTVLVAQRGVWISADSYSPLFESNNSESLITRRLFATGVSPAAACRAPWTGGIEVSTSSQWPSIEFSSSFSVK